MAETPKVTQNTASLIISGEISIFQSPLPASRSLQQGQPEAIGGYIAAYYYAALTNVSFQAYLSAAEQLDDNDGLRGIIDASYKHFYMLDNWFAKLDPNELQTNPNLHLFQEARDVWRPWVKDSTIISKSAKELANTQ